MSTSPAENPVPGVVTFTAHGNAALDQLAEALAADCDGSPTSIADILERVLEADIEDLAESLSATARPAGRASLVGSRRRGGRAAGRESRRGGPPPALAEDARRRQPR
jgi:hypothetical protein